MYRFTADQRRRRLAVRQHLALPARTVEQVAASSVGLHSSDPATVYLSCRARIADFRQEHLEESLYEVRSLLRMLGMRRTMFVVPHDLAAIMDAACARALAAPERRRLVGYLESQGVAESGEPWLTRVEEATMAALDKLGPATARQLTAEVPDLGTKLTFGEGKEYGGQIGVSTRVLFLLATSARIVRGRPLGTWVSTQYRWVDIDQWLPGGLPRLETEKAQAELVGRWLRSYGPGSLRDITWWTGWGKGVATTALEACGAVAVDIDGSDGFALADDFDEMEECPTWAAFLPGLDPTIMAWKDREWYLGDHAGALYDRNGNAGPSIWLDGRVVGGWSQRPDGEIRYRLLEDVGGESQDLVAAEAARLQTWLGESRFTTRFRTPLEKDLAAGN